MTGCLILTDIRIKTTEDNNDDDEENVEVSGDELEKRGEVKKSIFFLAESVTEDVTFVHKNEKEASRYRH